MDSTKERLVMAAMRLFAEKGYQSTSVADILRAADANAGSLYHVFPTKQDLLVEVLDAYRNGIEPMLLQPAWVGVEDPIERVFALLAAYRRMLEASDCIYGCPIGSLALELHEPDPEVRQGLAMNFDGWVRHVEGCFEAARGRLAGADPHKLAVLTLTVMEGGVMQSRTQRTLEAFDVGVEQLRDYLDRLEQAASAGAEGRGLGEAIVKRVLIGLGLAALLAGGAVAEGKYPDVHNTSMLDAQGSRVLQLSIDLNAPPKAVWNAFMDAPTVRKWEAPLAEIDLRQGGTMEESYSAQAKVGDPQNIRHEIIAYLPGQMAVFRNTNAPTRLPGHEFYHQVVTILQVQDLGGGRSRLVLSQAGYAPGPEFDKLYAFFSEDNAELMEDLKAALERPDGKLHDAGR